MVGTFPGRGRWARKSLTDANQQEVVAALPDGPGGVGSHIMLVGFTVSNEGAGTSIFSVKDGTTVKVSVSVTAGSSHTVVLPMAMPLSDATALNVQQSAAQNGAITAYYYAATSPT